MLKRFLTLGCVVLAVMALNVSVGMAANQSKQITVAVMLPNCGDTYFQTKWYGYSDEAKKLGVKAILYDAGGYENVNRQLQQLEDVIQKKVDAIIWHPCNSEAGIPILEEAIRAGIKVVNDNQPCPCPSIHATIMRDFYKIGNMYAQWVTLDSKGKGKVIILPGPVGGEQNLLLLQGQKDYFVRWPGIKILAEQFCPANPAAGLKTAEELLQAHPDVQYITTFADLIAQGVIQALKADGRKPGEVKVVCFNMSPATEKLVREGWISAVVIGEPVMMARKSMRMAVGLVRGENVPKQVWTTECMVEPGFLDALDDSYNNVPPGWKFSF